MKSLRKQYEVLTEKELLNLNGGYGGSSGSSSGRGRVSYGYSGHSSGGGSSRRKTYFATYKRYSF